MLSDEEKEAIELLEDYLICGNKEGVLCRNLRIISTIIEKQQKEIEELKLAFNNCFDECTSLRENFHKQIEISKNNDKKWEDKIKAEIEELQEDIKYSANPLSIDNSKFGIKVLQSLLEKEGE